MSLFPQQNFTGFRFPAFSIFTTNRESGTLLRTLLLIVFSSRKLIQTHNNAHKARLFRTLQYTVFLTLSFLLTIANFQIMSTWSNAPWGLGSNGGRDGCVYSGPFGKHYFSLTSGKCLKRNFNGNS